ncbi:MAG: sodium/proton-translocating pyrophosphatase [Clostridia bacterium]|nr:sodium/proton-translocating pyrophosphatase [Clostridia bacterium]
MINKKQILKFQLFSIVFTMVLGTLLHFTYEWSNYNPFVATFSSVNESTWEHLKLLFFPMFFTTIIGYFFIKRYSSNYLCSKVLGIITALSFVTIFFYTYTGILGTNIAILDIGSFFVAVLLGECVAYKNLVSNHNCNNFIAFVVLITLFLGFVFFTYFPPHIGYFQDPVTNQYGIVRRS